MLFCTFVFVVSCAFLVRDVMLRLANGCSEQFKVGLNVNRPLAFHGSTDPNSSRKESAFGHCCC